MSPALFFSPAREIRGVSRRITEDYEHTFMYVNISTTCIKTTAVVVVVQQYLGDEQNGSFRPELHEGHAGQIPVHRIVHHRPLSLLVLSVRTSQAPRLEQVKGTQTGLALDQGSAVFNSSIFPRQGCRKNSRKIPKNAKIRQNSRIHANHPVPRVSAK